MVKDVKMRSFVERQTQVRVDCKEGNEVRLRDAHTHTRAKKRAKHTCLTLAPRQVYVEHRGVLHNLEGGVEFILVDAAQTHTLRGASLTLAERLVAFVKG